ncbi:jacalin-related lectin 3-like [Spinacia oleracea]|uniref:Jacalin-related lectin 3-like n=1 Tax=Spinacia oleracea TaxID=3562 RepID=A0ABM3RGS7_SPIOL|nr:jacalin-related lectin 3-like [Spinacia oleracea]
MAASLIKIGPAGRTSNNVWDDSGRTKITAIYLSYSYYGIRSLQFQYDEAGISVISPNCFGSHSGPKFTTVAFETNEYVTGISGIYHNSDGLTSLSIQTNRRTLGPFGNSTEHWFTTRFSYQFGPTNRFGGFYGSFLLGYYVL